MKALVLSLAFLALLSAFLAVPATACDGVQAFRGPRVRQFNRGFNAGQRQAFHVQQLRFGVVHSQRIVVNPYTGQAFLLGY